MNFSQLIKTLVDYLDLGKRIATTIPGMVLALGIVAFYTGPKDFLVHREITQQASTIQQNQLRLELLSIQEQQNKIKPDGNLLSSQDALTRIRAQIPKSGDISAQLGGQLSSVLQQSFYSFLMFGLLGFAIGTVLDPVNKALFLQVLPALGKKVTNSKVGAFLTGYGILVQSKEILTEKYSDHAFGKRLIAQDPLKLSPQYYIGRGLISASEYDDLISKYYRFTEISIGMIIPSAVLILSACYLMTAVNYRSLPHSLLWTVGIISAAAVGLVLHRVGLRRYGEFRSQVFDLIAGREQAHEEQMHEVPKDEVVVLARALHRVEHLADKLERETEQTSRKFESALLLLEDVARRIDNRAPRRDTS
jgi:hypothetical protein